MHYRCCGQFWRAFVLWSRPSLWRYVQRQAMNMDFSWQVAAHSYRELYQPLAVTTQESLR